MSDNKQKDLKVLIDKRQRFITIREQSWDENAGEDGNGDYTMEEPKEIDELAEKIIEFIRIEKDELSCDLILEALTYIGHAPQVIYDDNGHWAVTSSGMSPVPMTDSGKFESTESFTAFVEPEMWNKTIREALYHYLDACIFE